MTRGKQFSLKDCYTSHLIYDCYCPVKNKDYKIYYRLIILLVLSFFAVTEYSITVYTSNMWWAGTDANVFLELRSNNGDSSGEFQLHGGFEAGE
jgi:hypothetical protein